MQNKTSRRDFVKKTSLATAGLTIAGMGMSAKSYGSIIGANDRMNVAIVGLGRRYGAFIQGIADKNNNANLMYLCDVMDHQLTNADKNCQKHLGYKSKLEKDVRKVFADKQLDAVFIATPDHWHAPGAIMALQAGKHVYLEKPCSHNMHESELLVAAQQKYGYVIQMGNQQRSSDHTIQIIDKIRKGVIGEAYKAVAFYTNARGEVVNPKQAAVPQGLDWDLFQGPSPRKQYMHDTWDYNWHWYGWDFGTAELGNNATHELDIARWALDVKYPERIFVEADKRHFKNDGWEMYDTMEATFEFEKGKIITWDGKSRNGYSTYGAGRGTIIYGSEGTVFVDRDRYTLFDRGGKLIEEVKSGSVEGGTALGGGGDMTTKHVVNFFNTARGKDKLTSPIDEGAISQAMVHYGNVAYRIGTGFEIDPVNGRMYNRDAMRLWGREYEKGWEPKL